MSTIERRYRVPRVTPDVNPVSLSDFDIEEIREYVRRKETGQMDKPAGAVSTSGFGDPLVIESDDLDRAFTLLLCGQKHHAQQFILGLVSDHIGKDLT